MKRLLFIALFSITGIQAYTWRVWNDTSETIRVTCSSSDIFTKFDAKTVKPGDSVRFQTKRGQCLDSVTAEVKSGSLLGKRAKWTPKGLTNIACASYDFHVMLPDYALVKAYEAELTGGGAGGADSAAFQEICNVEGNPWWMELRKVKIEEEKR
jgi:hypothetical protein